MERYWFLTSTTYATWLPGDVRGFVSNVVEDDGSVVRHNVPGTPYDQDRPEMVGAARGRLKGPPIYFREPEAHCTLDSFLSTERFRGWALLAGSVMCNHFHLVVGVPGDPDPDTLLQKFKGHASACLNEQFGRQPSETWWTRGGSARKLKSQCSILEKMQYTITQHGMLAMYLCPREVFVALLGEPEIDLWRAADESPR